jgi:uncharacterized protein
MSLNKQLLEEFTCHQCYGKLRLEENLSCLICDQCKLLYEIKNNIPIMLAEEAKIIT